MIKQVRQIGIPVQKMERAVQFYKELLELQLLFETNTMAFFNCNDLRLLLSIPENKKFANASSTVYFEVDEIEATYTRLQKNGVMFTSKPHVVAKRDDTETWMAFFQDSEQNTHAITSEVSIK
ncbi:VOC family protein [Pseudalkalibacillus hwajinpoensis]|uniref:VOC family protein n=1 Tax=Guptibacillus hwajinpoensis TaxID=208199 RepID=A0A4U1MA85_9BACL|nr:VOC family protein [Pseudalkalibacillus hwajinpoensis]TKD67707.1 VOC family protein [Pseudalkalibacillus hwajinpoensis]